MDSDKVYRVLSRLVNCYHNCSTPELVHMQMRHLDKAEKIIKDFLPHGSGWDHGTKLDWVRSTKNKLVFFGEFHHMNESGYYDGWTSHNIIVTPVLDGDFDLHITGRDRNNIKEYLHDMLGYALALDIDSRKYDSAEPDGE